MSARIGIICAAALICRKHGLEPDELRCRLRKSHAGARARRELICLLRANGWGRAEVATALDLSAHYVSQVVAEANAQALGGAA